MIRIDRNSIGIVWKWLAVDLLITKQLHLTACIIQTADENLIKMIIGFQLWAGAIEAPPPTNVARVPRPMPLHYRSSAADHEPVVKGMHPEPRLGPIIGHLRIHGCCN